MGPPDGLLVHREPRLQLGVRYRIVASVDRDDRTGCGGPPAHLAFDIHLRLCRPNCGGRVNSGVFQRTSVEGFFCMLFRFHSHRQSDRKR
jgi:hypothetical protein